MLIFVYGENISHLNSPGMQLSLTPIMFNNLNECNKVKPLMKDILEQEIRLFIKNKSKSESKWLPKWKQIKNLKVKIECSGYYYERK